MTIIAPSLFLHHAIVWVEAEAEVHYLHKRTCKPYCIKRHGEAKQQSVDVYSLKCLEPPVTLAFNFIMSNPLTQ